MSIDQPHFFVNFWISGKSEKIFALQNYISNGLTYLMQQAK